MVPPRACLESAVTLHIKKSTVKEISCTKCGFEKTKMFRTNLNNADDDLVLILTKSLFDKLGSDTRNFLSSNFFIFRIAKSPHPANCSRTSCHNQINSLCRRET